MTLEKLEGNEDNIALKALEELKVPHTTYVHGEAKSVAEQFEMVGSLSGMLTKNLVVKDKKHGAILVVSKHDREFKIDVVPKLMGIAGKTNFRFPDAEFLSSKLGVVSGAVSALSVMNDKENEVQLVIDKALVGQPLVNLHPLRNDRTTSLSYDGILSFLKHFNHEPTVIDFDKAPMPEPPANPNPSTGGQKNPKPQKQEKPKKVDEAGKTKLSLSVTKSEDFVQWYREAIYKSEMIDNSDISGCYILRPWSFSIWESITAFFDKEIKDRGVKNSYFPMFVSKAALETEKDHVEGFAPEVAWVTKSGDSDLATPIAVRPTSETIMYPLFKNWIRSHRDLPLKLNQWCNVVRWEFKDPTPFLRTREFLWQEGHTVHRTFEEANDMVMDILDLYRRVYEELLAIPVIKGRKTEHEKFAGGHITTTVEAYINGTGRSIQGATSHHLGQNFGKMFHISYTDENLQAQIPWQTSWGLTTRTIGVMVMAHGDDKGLVLPPRVAPVQIVIIPILKSVMAADEEASLMEYCKEVTMAIANSTDMRIEFDDRDNYSAGWKYNHWEQKGVPIRIEIGPRDFSERSLRVVRRDTSDKMDIKFEASLPKLRQLLDDIQVNMFIKAKAERDAKYVRVTKWDDFVPALNNNCIVLTPFCNETEWEKKVKEMSRAEGGGDSEEATAALSVAAKSLCIPFDQPDLPLGTPCFVSGKAATCWVLWGRSY